MSVKYLVIYVDKDNRRKYREYKCKTAALIDARYLGIGTHPDVFEVNENTSDITHARLIYYSIG